ncbi:UNVERIFIED_CONTAM: hypothetical protein Scaly_0679400, partial [Sesamum calycinum]
LGRGFEDGSGASAFRTVRDGRSFPMSIPFMDTFLDDVTVPIHNVPNSTDTHLLNTSSVFDPPISSILDHSSTSIPSKTLLPHKELLAALSIFKNLDVICRTKSSHDYCLFLKDTVMGLLVLLIYVDDVMITPCSVYVDAALHLICYLKGCPDRWLFFPSSDSLLSLLTATQTGLVALIPAVARSVAEAENRSMGSTVCKLRWISYLLQDLRVPVSLPIPLYCDNQAALHIVVNPVFHKRTKHLEIDCHLVRDHYKAGFVLPSHISGTSQLADLFTKTLPHHAFLQFLSKIGLISFPQVHFEGR